MPKLVLIGGPPAVGKSSVLRHLARLATPCAVLDPDALSPLEPRLLSDSEREAWVERVIAALGRALDTHSLVFMGWVLANPLLVQRVLDGVAGRYDSLARVYLVATPEALAARHRAEPARARELD